MGLSVGVSTWLWHSPLDDDLLAARARRVADWGFDVLELPVEQPGDWDPTRARAVLDDCGLGATVWLVMPPGRELVATDDATRREAQDYLRHVVDVAHEVGAGVVGGPAYTSVGRTFALDAAQRVAALDEWREAVLPVVEHARAAGVRLAVEPLNRYETSFLSTVDQALEAVAPLPQDGVGVLLDTYHMNIEGTALPAAGRRAGSRVAHVQVSENHRGAPGAGHVDFAGVLDALDEVGYDGPVCIESFTPDNDVIAKAASIWRPLAPTQDDIATQGLALLRSLRP